MKTLVFTVAAAVLAVASATGRITAESSSSHNQDDEPSLPTPRYCSHREQMKDIEIEGLSRAENEELKPTLISVQVIARHGTRIPYAKLSCWDADPNPMEMTWDCGSESVMAADFSTNLLDNPNNAISTRFFRKRFDGGANILKGSCQIGQLLPEGREQHHTLGGALARAYVGKGKLVSTSRAENLKDSDIYLRSDDSSRVLASVQDLFNGMFKVEKKSSKDGVIGVSMAIHTTDYSMDILLSNARKCPRLKLAKAAAFTSPEMLDIYRSHGQVNSQLSEALGNFSWGNLGECLYVTRCTDRPLPPKLNASVFTEALDVVDKINKVWLTHDDALYSKLAMGPLVHEILGRMKSHAAHLNGSDDVAPPSKITLIGAHDFTIMPVLASLQGEQWPGDWAPYASFVAFELYKTHGHNNTANSSSHSEFAVRVLYQGKPVVIPQCGGSICTLDAFETVASFAKPMKDMPCTLEDGLLPPELITGDTSSETATIATTEAATEAAATAISVAAQEVNKEEQVSATPRENTQKSPQTAALDAQPPAVLLEQQLPKHLQTHSPLGNSTSGTFPAMMVVVGCAALVLMYTKLTTRTRRRRHRDLFPREYSPLL